MKRPLSNEQLIQLTKKCLDESINTMDASVTHQLRNSRQLALQHTSNYSHQSQWVGAFVTAMVLLMTLVWLGVKQPRSIPDNLQLVEEMMYTEENQDLINNLEFYKWLEERDKQGKLV